MAKWVENCCAGCAQAVPEVMAPQARMFCLPLVATLSFFKLIGRTFGISGFMKALLEVP